MEDKIVLKEDYAGARKGTEVIHNGDFWITKEIGVFSQLTTSDEHFFKGLFRLYRDGIVCNA